MSEFGVDFVVGRKKVTVAGAAKGSKDTLGHLFEHLVHLSHLAIDKTLFMVYVLFFLKAQMFVWVLQKNIYFFKNATFSATIESLPKPADGAIILR